MMIFLTIICVIALIILALLNEEEFYKQVVKTVMISIVLMLIIGFVYDISYNLGVKDGAYNQLRGKYEVTYVIDKDSCIVDTIIKIK